LANNILIKELINLLWLRYLGEAKRAVLLKFFNDNFITEINAFIADIYTWTSDKFFDLLLSLAAERALEKISRFTNARCHQRIVKPLGGVRMKKAHL
jgi:hypothetical protein